MSIAKALQKLEDRISGLNTMRGRLLKFVNPQSAPAPEVSKVQSTRTPAPDAPNTSTPTQADTPIQVAQSAAPEVDNTGGLSDQEKQERSNLINRLITTTNITNNDLAPLGLSFEDYPSFEGVAFRDGPTDQLKDYLNTLDSISALAVVYEALKNAPFRKLEARYVLGDDGGIGSLFFAFAIGLGGLYTESINANDAIKNALYFLITQATNYQLTAALAPSDNPGLTMEAQKMVKQLQDEFNSFYADFKEDLITLSYAFVSMFRSLEITLQEPLSIDQAIALRRNMRPACYSLTGRLSGALNPQMLLGVYVRYAVASFTLDYLRKNLMPLENLPDSITTPMGGVIITTEIKTALQGFYEFIKLEAIKINFAKIEVK
ncbi:hypothetical protein [Helicobacter suis]|uniref:hypothetical protein n=1 Tax=Helicobacter suis TaxID=104628 RepID=UPI0013D52D03|nr:hypothetical protein [Helicobacter suis]